MVEDLSNLSVILKKILPNNNPVKVWFMVFSNISVISWRSVLLVEETGVPGENPRPAASH